MKRQYSNSKHKLGVDADACRFFEDWNLKFLWGLFACGRIRPVAEKLELELPCAGQSIEQATQFSPRPATRNTGNLLAHGGRFLAFALPQII